MKIIFFGDSICTGQYVSIHKVWVANISHKIGARAVVFNSAVNGRTTRQALEDMPYHIQEQRPDILIIQFGMNDCNYWQSDRGVPRVSIKAFEANLEEIINRAFNFGIRRVLLNTNHVTGLVESKMPYTNITYEESNSQYNDIIRKVAQSNDVILNDIEKEFRKSKIELSDLLLQDLFHPNDLGHKLYCKAVYPSLKKIVEEL